jgi:hypothetical protein
MSTISFNDSLARGTAKRQHRELREEIILALDLAAERASMGRQRRSSLYRRKRAEYQKAFGEFTVYEGEDARGIAWIVLLPRPDQIGYVSVRAGISRKKPERDILIYPHAIFTWHAVQRVHQRLKTTEWEKVRHELAHPAIHSVILEGRGVLKEDATYELPSPSGLFLGSYTDEGGLIIKTFVDKEKLGAAQLALWESHQDMIAEHSLE